jgi:hypothetical protein
LSDCDHDFEVLVDEDGDPMTIECERCGRVWNTLPVREIPLRSSRPDDPN